MKCTSLPLRRREFITLLGGAAAALAAGGARAAGGADAAHRRVHAAFAADDPGRAGSRRRRSLQGLQQLGWTIGRNVRIDYRWGAGDADRIRKYAAELAALAPDVILASGSATMGPLLQATRTVPIVFVNVSDPVGAGFVDSLARPGGNATGFILFEYGLSGKWLELLKQIAPGVTRAAVIRDPAISAGAGPVGRHPGCGAVARGGVDPVNVRDAGEIERAVAAFARSEWRPDRDRERCGSVSSRSDRHAGGPAQAARGLLRTLFRRRRRPDLLWARSLSTSTGKRPATSTASSRARSRPTCRCRRRPSTSW